MKRKVLYLGNAVCIILAILSGYCIYFLYTQGIYQSKDFYQNKRVVEKCYHYSYSIEYYLNTQYKEYDDYEKFMEQLDLILLLPEPSNIRIEFANEKNEIIKTNIGRNEKKHLIYGWQITLQAESHPEQNQIIYMNLYLLDPLSEEDEFYRLQERFLLYQKIRIPVIILEIILAGCILLLSAKQIRSYRSDFPGDLAWMLWLLTAFFSGMLLYKVPQTDNYEFRIILSVLAALIQYVSVIKLAGLTVWQRGEGLFVKRMLLTGLNHKLKIIMTAGGFVICQGLLSFYGISGRVQRVWVFVFLQGCLLITGLILLLIWIGRNNIRLAAAVEQQMKSERLKTELITNVSHDIKTPVTSIINYVGLIKKEDLKNETLKEYVEVIDRQSLRLKKLVMDVIEASKAVTGNISPEMNPLDIRELLSQAVGEYEERLQKARLEAVVNTEEGILKSGGLQEETGAWMVMADGDRLWRVFDNLLSNICKYSAENTRVYIELQRREENFIILFKNISRDRLNITEEELFERFVRGDASRHTEGSGLGLTIARSLTELMGGRLEVEIEGDLFRARLSFKKI